MPIFVYPWPPVGAVGAEWTVDAPVARIRSMITGRDQVQASQRKRKIATIEVSALANGRMGAGYCEMLKDLLDGGIHAVRLRSSPINWHLDEISRRAEMGAAARPLNWRTGAAVDLDWQRGGGQPFLWFSGQPAQSWSVTPLGSFWQMGVSGLPRNFMVSRPGDFIRITDLTNPNVSEAVRVLRPAVTDANGQVFVKIDREPTITNGRVDMAGQDEGVFRVDGGLPRSVQGADGDWYYTWSFREVFADEVGGFQERPGTWT